MVEPQHVVAVQHLLRKDVVVVQIVGFGVRGALDHGEFDLLELFAFEARALGEALLRIFEEFAL